MEKKRYALFFATSNLHKLNEVKHFLQNYPIDLKRVDLKGTEIQGDTVEEIATASVLQAYQKMRKPIFTEDTGLFPSSVSHHEYAQGD